jgi:hypothetical protein
MQWPGGEARHRRVGLVGSRRSSRIGRSARPTAVPADQGATVAGAKGDGAPMRRGSRQADPHRALSDSLDPPESWRSLFGSLWQIRPGRPIRQSRHSGKAHRKAGSMRCCDGVVDARSRPGRAPRGADCRQGGRGRRPCCRDADSIADEEAIERSTRRRFRSRRTRPKLSSPKTCQPRPRRPRTLTSVGPRNE